MLVDGYNIINSWEELKEAAEDSLENARIKLIDIMQDYQGYTGCKVIIVFDAHQTIGGMEKHETFGGVDVVYTRSHETADHYIERWVDRMGRDAVIRVATSDLLEQTIVFSRGAVRVSARELRIEIQRLKEEQQKEYIEKLDSKRNLLSEHISPAVLEKLEKWRRQR